MNQDRVSVVVRQRQASSDFVAADSMNAGPAPAIDPPSLPIFTYDQIAHQLTHTYWGGSSHRFNVTSGGSLTVNLTGLNAVGQLLAREALSTWSDIIGVTFAEVATGGQIVFDDVDDGGNAHANAVHSGGIISSATVNVPRSWLVANGTTLDSYSFQTYLHEIGHALGLGHAGDYNNEAVYEVDASFQNDSWATTIMSYFNQSENSYFANQGFTWTGLGTPMNGDVIAATSLYGASTATRTGNTTYGYNSTADRAIFDAAQFTNLAYTIFDSGGIDTLDYSRSNATQLIDLNAERFSDVLGRVGNVVIARGVTIENAFGGSGNDTIRGNAVANDLRGGAGGDALHGGGGNDRVDGGLGIDQMYGGAGNDTYHVDSATDLAYERAGEGTDTVVASASFALRANIERLILTGTSAISGRGNDEANIIVGNAAANVIDGRGGADTMQGGAGDDVYYVDNSGDRVTELSGGGTDQVRSAITHTLGLNVEHLFLTGTSAINGTGNALSNVIYGNAAANLINGAGGADSLRGGDGNDTYYVDNRGDRVVESSAGGTDRVRSSVDYVLGDHVELLILTGTAVRGYGNALANTLYGNAAANLLDGRGGADTMYGGAGNDTYVVDDAADRAIEQATGGTDVARSTVTYVLPSNVENLILVGAAAINGTGNALGNVLSGNSGANILDGGAGADSMRGGLGNDTYHVDNTGDRTVEAADSGYADQVISSLSHRLAANIENLILTGSAISGTGNDLANLIVGNAAANYLDGGAGTDRMEGGAGNDTYYVDTSGDLILELFGAGIDTVRSTASYTLGSEIEYLVLLGTANINATGNVLANRLYGNSGDNVLNGAAGADRMEGAAGNDTYHVDDAGDLITEHLGGGSDTIYTSVSYTLAANVETLVLTEGHLINGTGNGTANTIIGNGLNNVLDGAGGADVMQGGAGNDIYYVDDASDMILDTNGNDVVYCSTSFVLPASAVSVYKMVLLGAASINATGNGRTNLLVGNDGNNILDGGGGADTMEGGAGDDIYVIDSGGESIYDSAGQDTVMSSVGYNLGSNLENLILLGTGDINGAGNALDNVMDGNDGNNILYGNAGSDTISGGGGNDILDGHSGNDILTGGAGSDIFRINAPLAVANVKSITDFTTGDIIELENFYFNNFATGVLAATAFYIGTAAQDASDRIIYDSATGNLYFDSDGTGAAAQVLFAQLSVGTVLTHADFLLF